MSVPDMGTVNERNDEITDASNRTLLARVPTLRYATSSLLVVWIVFAASLADISFGAEPAAATLAERYELLRPRMSASPFDRPLVVDSGDDNGRMHGEIYGELDDPFAPLAARLISSNEWCAVVTLHINVKACTREHTPEGDVLTVYSGHKFYEPIERTHAICYAFRVISARDDYLKVVLTAPSGPLGTRDYEIVLEAMPISGRTFLALGYAFRPSAASRFATAAYLATTGSSKAGFTIVGRRNDGQPQWIGGLHGIVERNAMRNFLALQAWLETRDVPAVDRVERRLQYMAELTARYPSQLVEMPASEYVAVKQREWREHIERERTASAIAERSD
jgi:hypothetical protein